eukprot:TRINITY_DN4955_c0_g1_i2.p1 TRINITY_DN4955_c0_g1~~TRINITY_DN4955_c0_g1_i2.p1  ORF type:complete len:151 (-),score=41.47 TRINITY_DN4955_c0_g1_i2:377-829(-)
MSVFDEAKALLEGLIESETTNPEMTHGCRIAKLDKFSGEIHTNARKGKIRLTYDLVINFKWVANPEEEGEEVDDLYSGTIKFSEVIDHEPEGAVALKTGKDKPSASAVNKVMKTEGEERCVELISAMLNITTEKHSEIFAASLEGGAAER